MGDIIHTLPAVAWLKQSHPNSLLTWLVEPQWAPLLWDLSDQLEPEDGKLWVHDIDSAETLA